MATALTTNGDAIISGNVTASHFNIPADDIARSSLEQDSAKPYDVPLTSARVWDAVATVLPGTSATDDLGITGGTWGTNPIYITTGDVKAGGCTRYAVIETCVPAEYVDGQALTIRVVAGMQTTVAGTSAYVDLEVYEATGASATGISADLCGTAQQDMNSLTAANYDFSLVSTDLVAGDKLLIRLKIAITDAATGTAVIGNVYKVVLLADVRG